MSAPITLILCMAGTYRRFREAGYETPKFLLELDGRTILHHVVHHLNDAAQLILVANERDRGHADAIVGAARGAGGADPVLVFTEDTPGQAATAAIGAREAERRGWGDPVVFHNIDTVLYGRNLARVGALLRDADGFIDTFPSDSPAYGYAEVERRDTRDVVVRIAEKVVISPHATSGLYGFSSPSGYLAQMEATAGRSLGEFYVSDVYKSMLDRGATILTDLDGERRTLVLGTPAEYEAHLAGEEG